MRASVKSDSSKELFGKTKIVRITFLKCIQMMYTNKFVFLLSNQTDNKHTHKQRLYLYIRPWPALNNASIVLAEIINRMDLLMNAVVLNLFNLRLITHDVVSRLARQIYIYKTHLCACVCVCVCVSRSCLLVNCVVLAINKKICLPIFRLAFTSEVVAVGFSVVKIITNNSNHSHLYK